MSNFIPTNEWQTVLADDVLPPGCEIRMSMSKQHVEARLQQPKRVKLSWWRRVLAMVGL